ncbi:MAG TPA: RNA polymerase sigma factor [Verrucomicrobiae bacterium]|nr:RNA polymerase sigma factor [Verrucomicrobiae bacterium]
MELLEPSVKNAAEFSEEEISALVLAAQAGDPEAFARVFRMVEAKLHRQALFLAGNEHQALDLLQETMLQAWKHLHRYDGRSRFFTWLCSIMMHRHYDWLRRLRIRAFSPFPEPTEETLAEEAPNPSETTADLERAWLMRQCLDQLPARQRVIVYLRFYGGESLEGIAAIAQCSLGTVKSRLFHGLERLAKMQKLKELRNE